MKIFFILAVVGAYLCVSGCVGARHSRQVVTVSPDGIKQTTKESTTLLTAFKKGEAEMLRSSTVDHPTNGYSRTIGVDRVKTDGDAKTAGAVSKGVVEGLR